MRLWLKDESDLTPVFDAMLPRQNGNPARRQLSSTTVPGQAIDADRAKHRIVPAQWHDRVVRWGLQWSSSVATYGGPC